MCVRMLVWVKRYKQTLNMISVPETCQGLVRREHKKTQEYLCNAENVRLSRQRGENLLSYIAEEN